MSRLIPEFVRAGLRSTEPKSSFKSKCSFAMLGTVGSGKTTVCGFITMTAITLSASNPEHFVCDVIESKSGILQAQSDLRRGRFPPKTDPNSALPYESGLLMRWFGAFGKKEIHVPICDVAGEVVADLASKYRDGMYDLNDKTFKETAFLVDEIKDRDGFILVIPASRALLFSDDAQLEPEPGAMQFDPDLNLARILETVVEHKRKFKTHPIQGIAVVVTKYDLVKSVCENEGMDLYDESGDGFRNFLNTCFPATNNKLRFFGLQNVAFFPSEVTLDGTWPKGEPRIKVLKRRPSGEPCRVPKYPEQQYVRLIEYLKTKAA